MLITLLQSPDPIGFEISQILITVLSLLIPAIVFLVGIYRDEGSFDGPLSEMFEYNASSFGTALGLQALIFALIGFLANLYYILFTILFSGPVQIGIGLVGAVSAVAIFTVSMFLFVMIWGLSASNKTKKGTEVERVKDDVDKTILKQEKKELHNELNRKNQDIAELTTFFKRLEIALERDDQVGEDVREVLDDAPHRKQDRGMGLDEQKDSSTDSVEDSSVTNESIEREKE